MFTAVATDTGWFRHSNTTPETFALAETLTRAGASPTLLYDELFERNTLPRLRLVGRALDRLQVVCGGRVAHTEVRRTDYPETGASPQDTEDLVGYTRSIVGVEVGLMFLEQPRGGIKVSFRSRKRIDVGRLAEQFGGGGHRLASGATLDTSLEEAKTLVLGAIQMALAGL
jgi:phosphoesterase RecJ-like protein